MSGTVLGSGDPTIVELCEVRKTNNKQTNKWISNLMSCSGKTMNKGNRKEKLSDGISKRVCSMKFSLRR